jgi:glutathione S-transferase
MLNIFRKNHTNQSENSNNQTTPIILWGVSISPYVRKIMVALAEKEISYEQREILPKNLLKATGKTIPADFEQASQLGKIPALQVGNFCIADSAAIAGYIDKKFPEGNKLYPISPENYARALWFEHYADNVLTEVAYKKIFLECVVKPKVLNIEPTLTLVEHAKNNELPEILNYLDQSVVKFNWIAGDKFSMADIAIATQLIALRMAGFEINNGKWNYLSQYLAKVTARPSFQKIISK